MKGEYINIMNTDNLNYDEYVDSCIIVGGQPLKKDEWLKMHDIHIEK